MDGSRLTLDRTNARGGRGLVWLVGGLAVVAYLWTLRLQFQFDDHWLILAAPEQLRRLLQVFGDNGPLPALLEHLFQPVVWIWLTLDAAISGEPLRPTIHHSTSTLVHAVTAMAMFVILRRHVQPFAAFAGAMILAVWPAGAQAVSWTAARGDMLWVTFTLLALLAAGRHAVTAGVCLALGFASKSSAWLSVPLVVAYAVFVRRSAERGGWRILGDLAGLLLPILVVAYWRYLYLGTWSMLYLGGVKAQPELLPDVLRAIPSTMQYTLAPRNAVPPEFGPWFATSVLGILAWACVLASLVARTFTHTRSAVARIGVSLIVVLVPLVPAAFLWHLYPNAAGIYSSRALYPVVAGLAVCAALAFDSSGSKPSRARRGIVLLGACLLALEAGNGMVHVARMETEAADRTRSRIDSVVDLSRRAGDDLTFVAEDPHPDFHGVLMTHTQLATALRPPFVERAVSVRMVSDSKSFVESGGLAQIAGRVQIVELERARFVPRSPVLPALLPAIPELVRDIDAPAIFRPRTSVSPRAAASLLIESGDAENAQLRVRIAADEQIYAHEVPLVAGRATLSLRSPLALATSVSLEHIELRVVEPVAQSNEILASLRPRLVRSLPTLTIVSPTDEARVPITDTPRFVIDDFPRAASLRLDLRLVLFTAELPIVYHAPEEILQRDGSRVVYAPRVEDFVGTGGLPWAQAMRKIYTDLAKPYGVHELGIVATAVALRGKTEVAKSQAIRWTIVAPR